MTKRKKQKIVDVKKIDKIVRKVKSIYHQVIFVNGMLPVGLGKYRQYLKRAKNGDNTVIIGIDSEKDENIIMRVDGRILKVKRSKAFCSIVEVDYVDVFREGSEGKVFGESLINIIKPDKALTNKKEKRYIERELCDSCKKVNVIASYK